MRASRQIPRAATREQIHNVYIYLDKFTTFMCRPSIRTLCAMFPHINLVVGNLITVDLSRSARIRTTCL